MQPASLKNTEQQQKGGGGNDDHQGNCYNGKIIRTQND